MRSSAAAAAAFALIVCASALAQPARTPAFRAHTEAARRAARPPWPADESPAGRTDLLVVLHAQASRSEVAAREAAEDAPRGPVAWVERALNSAPGTPFDRDRHPQTVRLLETLHEDLRVIARQANAVHPLRPRPAVRDAVVTPSLPSELRPDVRATSAYPSARGMAVRVWAFAAGEIFSAARESLERAADASGWMRVVGGAHYPSDLDGARIVARLVIEKLRANPAFAAAIAQARGEIAAAAPRAPTRSGQAGHYLSIERIPLAELLDPPPADGSIADAIDRAAVRGAQRTRDVHSAALARAVEAMEIADALRALPASAGIDPRALASPALRDALERVRDDLEPYIVASRGAHLRARPPRADRQLVALGELPTTPTYPSAKVWSLGAQLHVLAALVPTLTAHIDPILDEIGRVRVLAATHYPSDIVAAKRAAERFAQALVATPRFAAEREGLQREIERTRR